MLNSTFERIAGRRFIISCRERIIVNGYWMSSSRVNGSVMARLVVPVQTILDPLQVTKTGSKV